MLSSSNIVYNRKEVILIVSLYCFVALTSIFNLGIIAPVGFIFLLTICAFTSPRTGFLALIVMFYLPMGGVRIPAVFIISTVIVGVVNILKNRGVNWYVANKSIIILYFIFLLLRLVSITFVGNQAAFKSYFMVSASVLIHIIVISFLVKSKEDIMYILRMWGVIGAFAAILGYLHFLMGDSVYLRQIYIPSGNYDKSMIDGILDYARWIWAGVEPNFHGLILLIPFAINFSFLIKKANALNIALTIVTFFGIIGTFSRSSFIVSLFIVVLYVILPQNKRKIKLQRFFLIAVFLSVVTLLITTYFPVFLDRIYSIQEAATTGQGSGRLPLFQEAINNFMSNPLFGIGTGQTASVSRVHLESHNLFLQTLGENGIFSFLILLSIFWGYLRKSYALRSDTLVFLVAGIAIIINANTVSYFDMRMFFSLYVLLNFYYLWHDNSRNIKSYE